MRNSGAKAVGLVVAGALAVSVGYTGPTATAAAQGFSAPAASPEARDHREEPVGTAHIATRCRDAYQGRLQKLVQRRAREAIYFEAHQQAMEATVTGLDQLLADPNAHDAIPFHQRAAAQARDAIRPLIVERRSQARAAVDSFEKSFDGCFRRSSDRSQFRGGVAGVRSAFRDIFIAHGDLLAAAGAVVTAQSAQAHQYLTDADVEYLPVAQTFDRAHRKLRSLA